MPNLVNNSATRSEITILHRVERDGNRLRRFAHVSPYLGKLGVLNESVLRQIARLSIEQLPPLSGSTLIVGLTESSLFLSWFLASHLNSDVELRFTTREFRSWFRQSISFQEPHSHGPQHFLSLPSKDRYKQVLIIEDELTTGTTLKNLSLALSDISSRHHVVTLVDLRAPNLQHELEKEMASFNIQLTVTDLSLVKAYCCDSDEMHLRSLPRLNPFERSKQALKLALNEMYRHWQEAHPRVLYIVGECVDVVLMFCELLPRDSRPHMQQVTRSAWLIDGKVILTRIELPDHNSSLQYFLYNWTRPIDGCALIISEISTKDIARKLEGFLVSQEVAAKIVVVPDV